MMLPSPFNFIAFGLLPLTFLLYHFGKLKYGQDVNLTLLFSFLVPGLGVAYTGDPIKGLSLFALQWISIYISFYIGEIPPFDVKLIKYLFGIYFWGQFIFTGFDYKKKFGSLPTIWKRE
jgi:hypothetical protein